MIRSFLLIFNSSSQWDSIARANRSPVGILFTFVIPTALVCSAIECFGLVELGNRPFHTGPVASQVVSVATSDALNYGFLQFVGNVLVIGICSLLLYFQLRSSQNQLAFAKAFCLIAYCYGPIFLSQLLDVIPELPTYVCRVLGILLALKIMYSGMVKVVRPDPSKALGLYFLTSLMLIVVSGLVHFLNVQILEGRLSLPLAPF